MALKDFIKELKRRNVYKVATAYAITAWLVVQIVSLASGTFGAPGWVMKMVFVLLAAGFPIVLIIAWAFELTPEGLKKTPAASTPEARENKLGIRLNYWISGLLAAALLFLGIERIFFAESTWDRIPEKASIAVLPFDDFSPQGDQGHFADGISEELLNVLAKVEGIQVAGRTSSFQFRDKNPDLKEVGQKLGVNHILEGSVRKAGDKLRITAQLIRADNGFHLWSETYDRRYTAENIFDIQDEISRRVLGELKVRLLPGEEKNIKVVPTRDVEAYNLYLKGLHLSATWNPEDLEQAVDYFEQAIQLDQRFALAHAKKAIALVLLHYYGNLSYEEALAGSKKAADWAILFNSNLAEAYIALGNVYLLQEEMEQALAAFERAKELKPGNAEVRVYYSYALNANDKRDQAEQEVFYAYKLDPLSPLVNLEVAQEYEDRNELKKAEEHYLAAIELRPNYLLAYRHLADLYGAMQGKHHKAIITMHKAFKKVADKSTTITLIFYPALDLELQSFASHYLEMLKKDFPNNHHTLNAEQYYLMKQGRYNEVVRLIKDYDTNIKELRGSVYISRISDALLLTGRYDELLVDIRDRYPEALRTDTLNFERRNLGNILSASVALRRTGREGKADTLIRNVCGYIETLPFREYEKWNSRHIDEYAQCSGLLGNKEPVLHMFRERLEAENVIGHWAIFNFGNDLYFGLSREELDPFRKQEKITMKGQREQVIDYLKQEGEWRSEWSQQ